LQTEMTETMRRRKYFFPAVLTILAMAYLPLWMGSSAAFGQSKYVPVTTYDPKRNAAEDIEGAVKEAQSANKRVLLEVGGEWCGWCHALDKFFQTHPSLLSLREQNFVTVKINFSEDNENKDVLSRYGPISGYPHLFVLDSNGTLLHSQDTGVLESGKSYNLEKLIAFLRKWAPAG